MKLTRRDALGALSAAGITALAGYDSLGGDGTEAGTATETPGDEMAGESGAMMALAEVLYPPEAEVTEEYLGTYLYSRMVDEGAYRSEAEAGVETLDSLAQDAHGSPFAELGPGVGSVPTGAT